MIVNIRDSVFRRKRNTVIQHHFHQKTRLHICTEQHRHILVLHSFPMQTQNFLYYIQILFPLCLKFLFHHRNSCFRCWCDLFFKSFFIKGDQISRLLDDLRPGAIICIQYYFSGIGIIPGKIQHDLRFCSTKPVNGLIIITDDKQIVLRCRQHPDNVILNLVDILKLIDQNILIFPLPCRQNIRALHQQFLTVYQHVIKINKPVLMQKGFISFEYFSKDILSATG